MTAIEDPQITQWSASLSELPWPDGPGELPLLLTTLCDADEAAREAALGALIDSVLSEERIEAASVLVAEQLLALLGFDAAPDKDQLLVGLDALADSASALLELAELDAMAAEEAAEDDAQGEPDAELAQRVDEGELEVARQLRDAVVKGAPAIVALLDADDEHVRVCAPFALTVPLSVRPREITAALSARLEAESVARVRASVLLALGLSGQSPVVESIRAALVQGETPIERMAAAMALIPFFGHLVQDEAILTLIDALAEPDELRLIYSELPWADEDLIVDLGALLASFNDGGRCPVLAPLYQRLEGCDERSGTMALVEAALIIAFDPHGDVHDHDHDHDHDHSHDGDDDHDHGVAKPDLAALTGPQRELLARLGKDERLWSSKAHIGALLGEYGLPDDRGALRSVLLT